MLLSANEVSAELLTGRGGGDDAAHASPLSQQPSAPSFLPPLGEVIIMMLMLLIPSHSCFLSLCVRSAKSGRVLPSSLLHPTHMHTHFFSPFFLMQH